MTEIARCNQCQSPLAAGAVRCAACGRRQTIHPMIIGLIVALMVAAGVAYVLYRT